jgi:hypothetical protein
MPWYLINNVTLEPLQSSFTFINLTWTAFDVSAILMTVGARTLPPSPPPSSSPPPPPPSSSSPRPPPPSLEPQIFDSKVDNSSRVIHLSAYVASSYVPHRYQHEMAVNLTLLWDPRSGRYRAKTNIFMSST